MAARKLQQEIDKEFKRVAEGVALFEGIYEKLTLSTNPSQKEKLEDSLKKEIKKLQRSRDKIKGWASQNDIKDKKPLQDQRKLIETQMEKFKAVEKEMKTKAFSKEGLNAAAKLDPKEKEKMEVAQFLSDMVDELGRQVESQEAEVEAIQATLKKGKKDSGKADRMAELERMVERHKWHTGKLEILLRSLENGSVEVEQVKEIDDGIKYYVEQNQEVDFMEDDTIYDDLALEEEEDQFGIAGDNDKVSSQDNQSIQDEPPEHEPTRTTSAPSIKTKSTSISENTAGVRRPSVQMKSPLPALSTLHASLPGNVNGKVAETMRPAPLPTIPTGQPLKYASAAAAAASSVGIAPLPPPPAAAKTASPAPAPAQPVAASPARPMAAQPAKAAEALTKQPSPAPKEEVKVPAPKAPTPVEQVSSQASKVSSVKPSPQVARVQPQAAPPAESSSKARQSPSPDSGIAGIALSHRDSAQDEEEEESIYHLPSSLADLLGSFEETKQRAKSDQPFDLNMMNASRVTCPTPLDAEKPNHYKPQNPYAYTPAHYPQEPLGIFDDPRLYSRIDTDSLFYAFYYRQGTYQQYLAAKALKSQSWRFHKQYQTWFQRHEEPKNITEEFEQGTYRFFDYESTWMNRRKADFKFAYKFLEDDL
ncbi:CCR4-NOT transcription complex like protein [Zymoseptoria brevis]|uniref:General negative regulator of transcription subunit n=1 Tax=Zymoseptoria brevis TaxID=1047168 RepID=A0A0F4GWH2_9PEZI|nr:CCR4-NOT transcription complex like protein [Zymoseptoria brevis]